MSPQRIPLSNERAVATEPAWSSLGWALCCARQIAVSPSRKQAADAPANLLEPGSILHGSLDEFSHWAAPHESAGITSRAGLVGPTIGTKRPVVELRRPPKGVRPRRSLQPNDRAEVPGASSRSHRAFSDERTSATAREIWGAVEKTMRCWSDAWCALGRRWTTSFRSDQGAHKEATYVCFFCRNRVRLVDTQRGTDTSDAGQRQRTMPGFNEATLKFFILFTNENLMRFLDYNCTERQSDNTFHSSVAWCEKYLCRGSKLGEIAPLPRRPDGRSRVPFVTTASPIRHPHSSSPSSPS